MTEKSESCEYSSLAGKWDCEIPAHKAFLWWVESIFSGGYWKLSPKIQQTLSWTNKNILEQLPKKDPAPPITLSSVDNHINPRETANNLETTKAA